MIELKIWQFILILVIVLLVAAIVTFFITRKLFARQLEKNPPVNEAMILVAIIINNFRYFINYCNSYIYNNKKII